MSGKMTMAEFKAKVRESDPECAMCGVRQMSLISHLLTEHKMSAGKYVKEHPGSSLASPIIFEFLRGVGKNPFSTGSSVDRALPNMESSLPDFLEGVSKVLTKVYPAELAPYIPSLHHFEFSGNAKLIGLTLLNGRNYYVSGPTGSGKTDEVNQILARLQIPVLRANMHGDVTYHSFVGMMEANSSGTYFKYGMLPRAMKGGYPIILDELDFTPPSISAVLFPVLEKERVLYIPETGETITAEPGFAVFATGNTGGKGDVDGSFTGTEVMNTALLDRFPVKALSDYLAPDKEVALILTLHPNLGKDKATILCKLATEVRHAFKKGTCLVTLSTRKLLDIAEMEPSLGMKLSLDVSLMNWVEEDDLDFLNELVIRVGMDAFFGGSRITSPTTSEPGLEDVPF